MDRVAEEAITLEAEAKKAGLEAAALGLSGQSNGAAPPKPGQPAAKAPPPPPKPGTPGAKKAATEAASKQDSVNGTKLDRYWPLPKGE
jgi:hypothetical protein